jgi:hypothetical protein
MGKVEFHSVEGQIEHWVKTGKVLEENPELFYKLIRETQLGFHEMERGEFCEYQPG